MGDQNWGWSSIETLALFEMFYILRNNLYNKKNVAIAKAQN